MNWIQEKLKLFASKDFIKKVERLLIEWIEWKKIFINHIYISDEGAVSKYTQKTYAT